MGSPLAFKEMTRKESYHTSIFRRNNTATVVYSMNPIDHQSTVLQVTTTTPKQMERLGPPNCGRRMPCTPHTLQRASANLGVIDKRRSTHRHIQTTHVFGSSSDILVQSTNAPTGTCTYIHTVYLPLTIALVNCPCDEYDCIVTRTRTSLGAD